MQKYLCLICLKELSSKKTVINHLKNIHNENDHNNYESFHAEDNGSIVSDDCVATTQEKDTETQLSQQTLDNIHYDSVIQFGDMDDLINQELSVNPGTDIVADVNVDLLLETAKGDDISKPQTTEKQKKKKSKKKEEKVSHFKHLKSYFDDPNLMEPFELYKKRCKSKDSLNIQTDRITSSCLNPPTDSLSLPSDSLSIPSDSLSIPSDSLSVPSESLNLSSESLNLLSDSLSLPSDSFSLPSDGLNLLSDSFRLSIDNLVNPNDSLELQVDSFNLSMDYQDSLTPSVNREDLVVRSPVSTKKRITNFKVPYKQSRNCDVDNCSFCTVQTDCGQCVFCLNKLKM